LVVKLEREAKRRPVLLFENVKGTRFPVLTNLHASRPRLAAAMNAAPEATQATYLRAMDKPLVPKIVPSGPVHEVVLDGDQVNLYDLPQIVHHEGDAGAYVTAAISFARDPTRSEEHTSELQSLAYLVCRLLLEKKKQETIKHIII